MDSSTLQQALSRLFDGTVAVEVGVQRGGGYTESAGYCGGIGLEISDGQRFALPRKVLRQTCSPKFSNYALEFYSFVADNYVSFYSLPTAARSAWQLAPSVNQQPWILTWILSVYFHSNEMLIIKRKIEGI